MDKETKNMSGEKPELPPEFGGVPAQAPAEPRAARSLFEPVSLSSRLLPEDLPYAAEVEAALARRPTRKARWLSVGVFLFFASFIVWAGFATLDEVTRAEGQVVPSSRTQIIQNLEGGILSGVDVHEGQIVEKGDVLARLNNEMAESNLRDMLYKAMENLIAIRRLRASVAGDELTWPEDLRTWLERGTGYSLTEEQLTQSLSLIRQQLNIASPLLQRRSYSRVQYLELQERAVQAQGEIDTLTVSIPRAEAAASEAEHRMTLRKAEIDAALMEEINKRSLELASLREGLSAGSDRVTRTELRSPVRGSVKQIYINTVGGVVKPGEPIMEIVPLDDTLLVEARVRPADVAFLHPGQKAMVKVSAYDYSIYGGLDGVLEQISADTIEDKKGEFYYLVKVRTPKTAIVYHGEELPIMPGMMTTVDIMTGKKTVLDYLLKPILKAKQNALREK